MIHPGRPHLGGHLPGWLTGFHGLVLLAVLLGAMLAATRPLVRPDAGFGEAPAAAPTAGEIEAAVRSYLGDWHPLADPLVTLENGVQAKSSNVNGIEVSGGRYYYRLTHGFSADPVARGAAAGYQVVLVLDPGTEWETEVYRIP